MVYVLDEVPENLWIISFFKGKFKKNTPEALLGNMFYVKFLIEF